MAPSVLNWPVNRGDDVTKDFTIYSDLGGVTPQNLTGFTVRLTIRDQQTPPNTPTDDAAAVFAAHWISGGASSGIAVPTPSNGVIQLTVPDSETTTWTPGEPLYYDIQTTDGAGVTKTRATGTITVEADYTRTTP